MHRHIEAQRLRGLEVDDELILRRRLHLKEDVITHVQKHGALYGKAPLRRIDIQPIEERLGFVVDYVFKSVKKGKVSWDDILILPKSSWELKGRMSAMKQGMIEWIDLGLFRKCSDPDQVYVPIRLRRQRGRLRSRSSS